MSFILKGMALGAGQEIGKRAVNNWTDVKGWLRDGDSRMKRNISRQRKNFINKFRRKK